ncbi:NAD(P)H-dependent oxidoreductase [Pseudodesulfovibrio sp. zrk46]|uniref:FMN-dependent NADH-azoreductase n=1 Tax=Pseudodesulfovibrio sp. zrk46 TaxID=2725288 RepID=UPI00144A09F8|nr:NAD(P)H-dependent oxidoreductase [Pseudodesulfovibrio sp. zrk46]QJB57757.1 FMN-dependent NADH-azoreductase [Pseudodesulfovibrio sp. zrk46]
MSTLMFIQASPRGSRSHSIALANAFIKSYTNIHPETKVIIRNVFDMKLPILDEKMLTGKYNIMHGRDFTDEERGLWSEVEKIIEDFKTADKYVFAIPMWNFSLPYRLKHFMDVVAQPTYTFSVGPDGYKGLINAKAFIAYSRGGDYSDDSPYNFQASYMNHYLSFIGIKDVKSVAVQPTLAGGPRGRDKAKTTAINKALELAKVF